MKAFTRSFGIELEIIGNDVQNGRLAQLLDNAGIPTCLESYNHVAREHWKIVSDGSLTGRNAMELVSPVLHGVEGLEVIKRVCQVLNDNGITVNQTCGFHVHVDARDSQAHQVANVLRMWAKYETCAFSVLSPSRRNNRWASPLFSAGVDDGYKRIARALKLANNVSGGRLDSYHFVHAWNAAVSQVTHREPRYNSVNLAAFLRHGTIEFRAHQGTTDYAKIEAWVMLCVGLVSRAFKYNSVAPVLGANDFGYMLSYAEDYMSKSAAQFLTQRREHFATR